LILNDLDPPLGGMATTVEVEGFGDDEKRLQEIFGQHISSALRWLNDDNL
jgi:hypothetical protein